VNSKVYRRWFQQNSWLSERFSKCPHRGVRTPAGLDRKIGLTIFGDREPKPGGEAAKGAAHAAEIARLRIENAGLRQQLSQARPSAEVQDLLREIVTLKGQLAQASPHPGK
jgi:hypothetical protein